MAFDDFEDETLNAWTLQSSAGGTFVNSTTAKLFGNRGGLMTTDGDNDGNTITWQNTTTTDATFNLFAWVRVSNAATTKTEYFCFNAGSAFIGAFRIQNGLFKGYGNGGYQDFTATPSNDTWYRLRMVYDGTKISYYIYNESGGLIESKIDLTPDGTGSAVKVSMSVTDGTASVQTTYWDNVCYENEAEPAVTKTKTFTVDVVLKATQTKTFTADGILQAIGQTTTFTADVCLQVVGQTTTFTADVVLVNVVTKTFTVDVVLKAIGQTETFTADAVLKAVGLTSTFTADVLLQTTQTNTFTVDVCLQKTEQTETFTADAVLQTTQTKTFTTDAVLQTIGNTKSFTADSVLKAIGQTETFTTDAVLMAVGLTTTFTVDVTLTNETLTSFQTDFETILEDDFFDTEKQNDFATIMEDIPMSEDVTWIRTSQPEDEFGRASASSETFSETISLLIQPITEKDKDIQAKGIAITGHMKAYAKPSYDLSGGGSSTPKVGDTLTRTDGHIYEVETIIGKYAGSNIEVFRKLVLREIDNG